MPSKINSDPCQSALCVCCPIDAATCNKSYWGSWNRLGQRFLENKSDARVVRHKEVFALQRAGRKSLLPVPCHVVQGHECAVRQEQVVKQTATDNDVVGLFDNTRQRPEGRWWRSVTILIYAERLITTNYVVSLWCVDNFLNSAIIEVVVGTPSERREAKHIPEKRAELKNFSC